jgi:molybdopterin synthase sulfur carrier subunit
VDDSVEVRLFAAARAAAGRSEVLVPSGSLTEVLNAVLRNVTPNAVLNEVLTRSSFLVDEVAVHGDRAAIRVAPGARVDVLPPFAGG